MRKKPDMKKRAFWLSTVGLVALNVYVWTFPVVAINDIARIYQEDGSFLPPLIFSTQQYPTLPKAMKGSGEGKTRLLFRDYRFVYGHNYISRDQVGPSCVGHSTACALDILGAVEVRAGRRAIPPPASVNGAWLYGISRELGGLSSLSAGSHCSLAVRAANEVGFLYNENFIFAGYDLTTESYENAWRNGVPGELDPYATNYISGYFKLESYEDVRDAINNDMPVVVGSSVGFGRTNRVIFRDNDGFLTEPMFKLRGKYWLHAMAMIAVSDVGREGVLIMNSWGQHWVSGPQKFGDEPLGSFWIDITTVNKMARHGDCYAVWGLRRIQ